jgi:hypothetical protein
MQQHRRSPRIQEAPSGPGGAHNEETSMLQTAQRAYTRGNRPNGRTPFFMHELEMDLKKEQRVEGRDDAASSMMDPLAVLIERRKAELASLSASAPLQAKESELQSQASTSRADLADQQKHATSFVRGHQTSDALDQHLAHRRVGDEMGSGCREYGTTAEINLPNMIPAAILDLLLQEDRAMRSFLLWHCVDF